jgi:hypothetical protein
MQFVSFNNGLLGVMRGDEVVDVTELGGVDPSFWPPVGMVRFIEKFDKRVNSRRTGDQAVDSARRCEA